MGNKFSCKNENVSMSESKKTIKNWFKKKPLITKLRAFKKYLQIIILRYAYVYS